MRLLAVGPVIPAMAEGPARKPTLDNGVTATSHGPPMEPSPRPPDGVPTLGPRLAAGLSDEA